jgi:hypothetical protein
MSPMMKLTEPLKIVCGLHPGSHVIRVRDTGVVGFEPTEIDTVLKRELHVRVM